MSDLVTWLRAALDDDERVAREAINPEPHFGADDGSWNAGSGTFDQCAVYGTYMKIYDEGGHSRSQAEHIAYWDPARVLAEVGAKRRIVELHGDQHECTDLRASEFPYEGCMTLRLLALPYANRPGYRDEWRP